MRTIGELWRVRSPASGVDVVCTCRGIEGVGIEVRVDRQGELYQSKVFKTAAEAIAQSHEWKDALIERGWSEVEPASRSELVAAQLWPPVGSVTNSEKGGV